MKFQNDRTRNKFEKGFNSFPMKLKEKLFFFYFQITWRNPVHRPSNCCLVTIDFLFWCHDSDDYCSSDCCCCYFVGLYFQRCSGNVQELNCVFRLLAWDSMNQRVLSMSTQPWCWDLCTDFRPYTLNMVTWKYHMLFKFEKKSKFQQINYILQHTFSLCNYSDFKALISSNWHDFVCITFCWLGELFEGFRTFTFCRKRKVKYESLNINEVRNKRASAYLDRDTVLAWIGSSSVK